MSRATLGPEVAAALEECLEEMDQTFRRSRATLKRSLLRTLAPPQEKPATEGPSQGQAEP
jgi:hypothetical protein